MGVIGAPALLGGAHIIEGFDCDDEVLNVWLRKRALKNQKSGASRTFVICIDHVVVGYYALASGSVERLQAPKAIARNMPESIPVVILGRLAIDSHYQGQRLGVALLKDVMLRTLNISRELGVRALMVHAISIEARDFYLKYGFKPSVMDPMTLFLSITNLRDTLKASLG